jgi:hypothetical protein
MNKNFFCNKIQHIFIIKIHLFVKGLFNLNFLLVKIVFLELDFISKIFLIFISYFLI